jgi:hypothetical protein
MSDGLDATPTPPNGAPSGTVTAPAGATPPLPAMRVPRHGHGKLLLGGKPGNAGGGRHPEKVHEQLVEICGFTAEEMLLRLRDPEVRAKMTWEELRLALKEAAPYVLARRFEHSGPAGAPIPIETVANTVSESLRRRLQSRELLLAKPRPPA